MVHGGDPFQDEPKQNCPLSAYFRKGSRVISAPMREEPVGFIFRQAKRMARAAAVCFRTRKMLSPRQRPGEALWKNKPPFFRRTSCV
jgi:hypothetical protein